MKPLGPKPITVSIILISMLYQQCFLMAFQNLCAMFHTKYQNCKRKNKFSLDGMICNWMRTVIDVHYIFQKEFTERCPKWAVTSDVLQPMSHSLNTDIVYKYFPMDIMLKLAFVINESWWFCHNSHYRSNVMNKTHNIVNHVHFGVWINTHKPCLIKSMPRLHS